MAKKEGIDISQYVRQVSENIITVVDEELYQPNVNSLTQGRETHAKPFLATADGFRSPSEKMDDPEKYLLKVKDNYRVAAQKFWIAKPKAKKGSQLPAPPDGKGVIFYDKDMPAKWRLVARQVETFWHGGDIEPAKKEYPFGSFYEVFELQGNPVPIAESYGIDPKLWINNGTDFWPKYINLGGKTRFNIFIDKPIFKFGEENLYSDHVFLAPTPFAKSTLDKKSVIKGSLYYDVKPTYNVYIKDYEKIIPRTIGGRDGNWLESMLPNLHVFYSYNHSNKNVQDYKDLISLKGQFSLKDFKMDDTKKGDNIRVSPSYKYFSKYAEAYDLSVGMNEDHPLVKKYTNIGISMDDINLLSDSFNYKHFFPMYTDIEFQSDTSTELAQALKDLNLTDLFLSQMMTAEANPSWDELSLAQQHKYIIDFMSQYDNQGGDPNPPPIDYKKEYEKAFPTRNKSFWHSVHQNFSLGAFKQKSDSSYKLEYEKTYETPQRTTSPVLDVGSFYQKIIAAVKKGELGKLESFAKMDKGIILFIDEELQKQKMGKFLQSLMIFMFSAKMRSLVKKHFRTFKEMMEGKPAYSETVLYRIEKLDEKGNLIQNFFIPNSSELDIINYVDTQVRYNKQYRYNVYAQDFVIGTKYWYEFATNSEMRKIGNNITETSPCDDLLREFKALTPSQKIKAYKGVKWDDFMGGRFKQICGNNDKSRKLFRAVYKAATSTGFDCNDLLDEFKAMTLAQKIKAYEGVSWDKFMDGRFKQICGNAKSSQAPFRAAYYTEFSANPALQVTYNYNNKQHFGDPRAFITARYAPSLKIVEFPYFTVKTHILDSPPMPPDVNIIPYVNKNDQLLFNLNRGIGNRYLNPITLNASEDADIRKFREAHYVNISAEVDIDKLKVLFKSESAEPIKAFEIYRIDKKPKSYQDFSKKLFKTMQLNCFANSASFVDKTIKPNKKYYYIFRTIDIHGHFSNPSAVYEVQLIDDEGYIYPIISVVQFEEEKIKKQCTKYIKKYIYIKPSILQSEIDMEQFDFDKTPSAKNVESKDIKLGLNLDNKDKEAQTDTLWGKKFKLRLKSKKTGRIIDLNMIFRHTHIPLEDPQGKKRNDLC